MKRGRKFQVFIILVLIVAALTVPNEDQYASWLKSKATEKSDSKFLKFGVELLGSTIIKETTTCKQLIVFNYCRTEMDSKNYVVAIGVFNRFFPVEYQMNMLK